MESSELILCVGIFVVALLYSSVGHAGASGYIAVMALAEISATIIRPTALLLNIVVATIGSIQFIRAGHFRWRLFWPFAVLSIPAAYLGGAIAIPTKTLKIAIGCVLLASAVRLLIQLRPATEFRPVGRPVALVTGGLLGFLAGLTGTGGGIFLTPLIILMRWASTKEAAAVSVAYILVNSVSGLLGNLWNGVQFPSFTLPLILVVVVGGFIGSSLGSRRFSVPIIHLLLATVLIMAGYKLVFM